MEHPALADFDTLIDLITSTVQPYSWDVVGGPGSIEAEPTRMALVVSQSGETHDEMASLLTLLRRHRYEALHGSRPWETSSAVGPPFAAAPIIDGEGSEPSRLSQYPEAQRAELESLLVRREPTHGTWRWRCVKPSGADQQIELRLADGRLQCELPECVLRTEGDAAAVAWRGLRLVELGNEAEVLRRRIDERLPWLPHRSNTELARLFEVTDGNAEEGGRVGPPTPPKPPTAGLPPVLKSLLRRTGDPSYEVPCGSMPAGLARDGGAYLQIACSRADGQVVAWESYVDDKLTARIRFIGRPKDGPQAAWQTAVQEDSQGRQLARWELIEAQAKAAEIPPLADAWADTCTWIAGPIGRPSTPRWPTH